MILIAGTGRNSGKTTLACEIIRKFHGEIPLVAIKISPHHHTRTTCGNVLMDEPALFIEEETNPETGKDSARMLAAGADRSFFIMAADSRLPLAIDAIMELLEQGTFMVCESGGLRHWVEPGGFFVTTQKDTEAAAAMLRYNAYPHFRVEFDGRIGFDMNRIGHSDNSWKIKSDADTV
jgi:hypothetical protein